MKFTFSTLFLIIIISVSAISQNEILEGNWRSITNQNTTLFFLPDAKFESNIEPYVGKWIYSDDSKIIEIITIKNKSYSFKVLQVSKESLSIVINNQTHQLLKIKPQKVIMEIPDEPLPGQKSRRNMLLECIAQKWYFVKDANPAGRPAGTPDKSSLTKGWYINFSINNNYEDNRIDQNINGTWDLVNNNHLRLISNTGEIKNYHIQKLNNEEMLLDIKSDNDRIKAVYTIFEPDSESYQKLIEKYKQF